jgi:hypothetical protein
MLCHKPSTGGNFVLADCDIKHYSLRRGRVILCPAGVQYYLSLYPRGINPTKWKRWWNRVYYLTGWGIVVFMAMQALAVLLGWPAWMTIINEAAMLWLFGTAWLTKSQALWLKDMIR